MICKKSKQKAWLFCNDVTGKPVYFCDYCNNEEPCEVENEI